MPLSFGGALTNRGAPFPIKQAKLGMPFQKGHALPKGACPSKRCAPFQKGRALPKGARPSKRGAPFLSYQAKVAMPFQKVRALPKGERPFPSIKQCAKNLEWMEE